MRPDHLHPSFDHLSKKYGSPIRMWLGPILTVIITDAENVEIIMKSKECLNKPDTFYKMIRDGLSVDGLFTLKAEEWKVHRRLVSPTINQPTVSTHLPVFNENIRSAVQSLPTGKFFNILLPITKCKLTMFVEAALGTEWEPEVKQRYLQQFIAGVEIVAKRNLQPLYHIDWIWNLTKSAKRLKEYTDYGRNLFEKIIEREKKQIGGSSTLMGRLLDVSNKNPKFTIEDIMAETATILTGATDTSATTSAFVVLMLALHPEYQEKVFQEIAAVMPDTNVNLTQTDLEKLHFTDLCVRETLRLFPTVPLIGRAAIKPITLSNNVVVPPGVTFLFGLRQIQIQEKYFGPTATIFDPFRFLNENIKNLPASAYIPFSYGPRDCIGYYYAQASVKCFTAHLIRNYRLTTTYTSIDQLHLVQNASFRLVEKHMVKLEPRS